MIMGYPGSTNRFLTSWGVKEAVEIEQPARVKIRRIKLDIMDEQMSKSQKVRIQYASKYARVSNYWKYFIGQSEQLVNNKVADKKQNIESSFTAWYQKNKLEKEYGQALNLIQNATESSSKYIIPKVYFQEAVVGSELILFMLRNLGPRTPLYNALKTGEEVSKAKEALLQKAESYFKDYNAVIDENTLAAACAIEFLHTESVIHDDIIDNETLRRQKDPFHIKYGYNTSVLTGDFVLGLILNIASRINNPRITKNLATTAMMMSEGEILEGNLEASEDATFDDYLKVIEYKTAAAFEAASRLGGILSRGTEQEIELLANYGKNVGIAYQIRDDLLDWKNEDKLFNLLVKKASDPRNVFNKMEELLKKYSNEALSSIQKISESQAKNNLENLVSFTKTTV